MTNQRLAHLPNRLRTLVALVLALGLLAGCATLPEQIVWLDVRTDAEYAEDHIEGSEHIPHDVIGARIAELGLAKDAEIRVYCRSGKRAGIALATLQELGYSNVENVGGITDARELRD